MAPERQRQRRSRSVLSAALALVGAMLLGLSMLAGVAAASPTKDDPGSQSNSQANPQASSHPSPQASSHSTSGTSGTSGNPSSPQPQSNADKNSGGANGHCPGGTYCSDRHGAASLNGNGKGKATGKPCAGCVGKADNKNPPGQEQSSPRTTFPNNGYECDNNNGIGKTNPAHTGCTSLTVAPTTPPTSSTDCATTPPPAGCTHNSTTSSVSGGATVLGETFTKIPTNVLGERVPTVGAKQVTRTPSALPFTGLNAATLLVLGAAAALAGVVLLSGAGLIRRPARSRARASD
jgi:hypothetical protein